MNKDQINNDLTLTHNVNKPQRTGQGIRNKEKDKLEIGESLKIPEITHFTGCQLRMWM